MHGRDPVFFHSWHSIWRIVVLATVVYVALIAALRGLGARALARMSAYDLVITFALGSLIATIPMTAQVTLADGLAAIGTFLLLQHLLSWSIRRSRLLGRMVKERAHIVVWEGRLLQDRMERVNVTEEEVRAAVRAAGKASLDGLPIPSQSETRGPRGSR